MELNLKIVGCLQILLACIHILFPKEFNWKEELKSLSLLNRQILQVHTFFIALTVLLMGILSFWSSALLLEGELGKRVGLGLSIFWLCRLLIQLFGYSTKLWRGKPKETFIHCVFIFLWAYFSWTYLKIFLA